MKAASKRSRIRKFTGRASNVDVEEWTGPVERRDPELVRQTSVQNTWVCRNPSCRQWAMNGAHLRGRCNFCQTPRGA